VPPVLADETSVKTENNTVFIEGKTKEDFDLATIKFLIEALDLKVD
jgi:hypothetical protein